MKLLGKRLSLFADENLEGLHGRDSIPNKNALRLIRKLYLRPLRSLKQDYNGERIIRRVVDIYWLTAIEMNRFSRLEKIPFGSKSMEELDWLLHTHHLPEIDDIRG